MGLKYQIGLRDECWLLEKFLKFWIFVIRVNNNHGYVMELLEELQKNVRELVTATLRSFSLRVTTEHLSSDFIHILDITVPQLLGDLKARLRLPGEDKSKKWYEFRHRPIAVQEFQILLLQRYFEIRPIISNTASILDSVA